MTSETPVGWAAPGAGVAWSRRRRGALGRCGGAGRVLHEVWVLLTDRWVYSTGFGVSCSTDSPWPVSPDPCAMAGL